MHVTTIAAVFILQDGEWVAMKQDTESSWIFLRLKTVKTSEVHVNQLSEVIFITEY